MGIHNTWTHVDEVYTHSTHHVSSICQVSWSSQIQLYSAMAFSASVCDFLTESAHAKISTSSDVQKKLLGVLANLEIAKDLERPQINTDTFTGMG